MYFANLGVWKWTDRRKQKIAWWCEFWWLLQTVLELILHLVSIQDTRKLFVASRQSLKETNSKLDDLTKK